MKVDSCYLAVRDRVRAEAFWKRVFDREPARENENFTFFDIDGFLFGLFDPASLDEGVRFGNNSVVCIRVDDADAEHARLSEFAEVVLPLHSIRTYRVFQIADPEGNVVEFYSETEPCEPPAVEGSTTG